MRKISFAKMVASGNDFVVIDGCCLPKSQNHRLLAKKICDRKFGIGADGMLLLEKSKVASVRMRIFNADGSEAEMCGNGARCAALWASEMRKVRGAKLKIETKAGIIEAEVAKDKVRVRLTDPHSIKLDLPIKVNDRVLHVNFINTGVPHAVIFVDALEKIDVDNLGRQIRWHKAFAPRGTNVNFIEVLDKHSIAIRTYERGVEGETLACGTGSSASALIFALKAAVSGVINVHTKSQEILKVYFNNKLDRFSDVWLEGKAGTVYKGEYYV